MNCTKFSFEQLLARWPATNRAQRRWALAILMLLALLSNAGVMQGLPAGGGVATASAAHFSPPDGGPTDVAELESFLDSFFQERMETYHVPGAAFVLVKDGALTFSKGYGTADLATGQPVDPARTLFNLGSVGKLFTATAVMQLAEQGRLNPDDPVAKYVNDIPLASDFAQPITIAQLLSHTAGFEERVSGAWVSDPKELLPLGTYLASSLPAVVLPPGDQISYSNHGFGLAGYVVEKVSGMPFAQYVEENILTPLGMQHTSYAQPLPPALASNLATGYTYGGDYAIVAPVYGNLPPAGGQHATAADMSRFMLAQLGSGPNPAPLLREETLQIMQSRHTAGDARLEGYAYAFGEYFNGDLRALVKGGDSPGFATQLVLVPEHHLGFFVAFNANLGLTPLREELNQAFFDHYFPLPPEVAPAALTDVDLQCFAGNYRLTRYARTTIDKALAPLQMIQIRVRADDDTISLIFPALMGFEPTEWVPVAPLLFREVEGSRHLGFQQDERGRITHMTFNIGEPALLERVPWFETFGFQMTLLALFLLLFLSTLLWPLAALWQRLQRHQRTQARAKAGARFLAGLLAALNLLFLVAIVSIIVQAQTTGVTLLPAYLRLLLALPLLTSMLAVAVFVLALAAWRRHRWSRTACLHYTTVATAGLLFIWFTNYWNLLGYRL